MRLVYESNIQVVKSFRTYHGQFPSGYDGATSINNPPSKPVNNASTSRQSRFNCNDYEAEETVETYHVAPISAPAFRDSRSTSRDGSPSSQHAGGSVETTSFSREIASEGGVSDDSDIVRDGRGNSSGFSPRRGHRTRDGCGGCVGDGSSSSVGS
eukprot:scaffold30765_cov45-Cyclotella_meneghiniana.AAC.1